MTKNRHTRKKQSGGTWYDGLTGFITGATQKAKDTTTNILGKTEGLLTNAQYKITDVGRNVGNKITNLVTTTTPTTTTTYSTTPTTSTYGGKKHYKTKKTKKNKYNQFINEPMLMLVPRTRTRQKKGGLRTRKSRKTRRR
jgi:hypothetical protein